jgi:hypothetical protein
LPILAQHSDLVATLAADYGIPFSVLEKLLKRESAFGQGAADEGTTGLQDAGEDRNEAPSMAGLTLRLVSLATENLCPLDHVTDASTMSDDLHLEIVPSVWSLPDLLKLVLLGTEDAGVRFVGFPPKELSRHEYVLGAADIWPGLLRPEPTMAAAYARIEARFDGDGMVIAVERTWHFEGTAWIEDLHVHENGRSHTGRDASVWLAGLLPRDLVPLFAYDASDILALTLSAQQRRRALERLYPLAFLAALASSVRDGGMPTEPSTADRRLKVHLSSEIATVRRRMNHAAHMHDVARNRIRLLENELAAAGRARDCLREIGGMQSPLKPILQRRGKPRIAIPEPLSPNGSDTVGISVADRRRQDGQGGISDRLAANLADLDTEMNELRGRIEAARDDEDRWTRSLEAYSWKLRAYVAEEELAKASRPLEAAEADRLERCLEELTERLRQRSRNAVRAALARYAPFLDLPAGCVCELDLDDEDGLRLGFGLRPSEGMGSFIEERAALLLMHALQEISGCSMPVFAVLDPQELHERNRTWLQARYVPLASAGTIILSSRHSSHRPDGGRMRIHFLYPVGD